MGVGRRSPGSPARRAPPLAAPAVERGRRGPRRASRGSCTASPSSPSRTSNPSTSGSGGSVPGALRRAGDAGRRMAARHCARPTRPPPAGASSKTSRAEAGRRIDPEHFGVSIGYTRGDAPSSSCSTSPPATRVGGAGPRRRTRRPTSVTSCPTASRVCAGSSSASSTSASPSSCSGPSFPRRRSRDELRGARPTASSTCRPDGPGPRPPVACCCHSRVMEGRWARHEQRSTSTSPPTRCGPWSATSAASPTGCRASSRARSTATTGSSR